MPRLETPMSYFRTATLLAGLAA
ncbi:MAG: hypothetical protein JWP21_2140, partial [Tardiphaga sp.]|nr:hypothetical protein [Tardiphaga sp.]